MLKRIEFSNSDVLNDFRALDDPRVFYDVGALHATRLHHKTQRAYFKQR